MIVMRSRWSSAALRSFVTIALPSALLLPGSSECASSINSTPSIALAMSASAFIAPSCTICCPVRSVMGGGDLRTPISWSICPKSRATSVLPVPGLPMKQKLRAVETRCFAESFWSASSFLPIATAWIFTTWSPIIFISLSIAGLRTVVRSFAHSPSAYDGASDPGELSSEEPPALRNEDPRNARSCCDISASACFWNSVT
mmetsp:Transcript_59642/g.141824  ORF Transcript_59642/g.141824 Transcript_59642/m.141824 type:complete len:201 (+) Transcript_59642:327-929(+)